MWERLKISAEVWGIKARRLVALLGQLVGFAILLLGAFVLFVPAIEELGVPVDAIPTGAVFEFYDSLGLHWIILMIAGAAIVWLTTRA